MIFILVCVDLLLMIICSCYSSVVEGLFGFFLFEEMVNNWMEIAYKVTMINRF